jgi:hypothetical protein
MYRHSLKLLVVLLISIGATACASIEDAQPSIKPIGGIACTEPRPQMCTRDYRPVCGMSGTEQKTYGNACSACADKAVISYREGSCEQKKGNGRGMDVK